MSLLDIVYCYVSETIPFTGDFEKLQNSFRENGFTEEKKSDTLWKYTRGAGLALEVNYDSESTQMNVFLEKPDAQSITIKVGNWGFPFEPLLMKKRFRKNLERIVSEVTANQVLSVNKSTVQQIQQKAQKQKSSAILLIVGVIVALIVIRILGRWIL
jgi:hypothetical protein